jgi:hypothetical protein
VTDVGGVENLAVALVLLVEPLEVFVQGFHEILICVRHRFSILSGCWPSSVLRSFKHLLGEAQTVNG